MDGDLHTLTKCLEKPNQPVHGVAFDSATYERGNFRLIDSKKQSRRGLREISFRDQNADLLNQARLGKSQFRVRETQISEYVPASWFNRKGLRTCSACPDHSWACAIAHSAAPQILIEL
jgi:hypothetical protein